MSVFQQPIRHFIKLSDYTYKLIKKCCNGDRVIDLLFHFPISIIKRSGDINNFKPQEKLTVVLKIINHVVPNRKGSPYKIIGQTDNGDLVTIIYFNYRIPYLKKIFLINERYTISGKAECNYDGIKIFHPDVVASPSMLKYYIGVEPIYPLVGNLTNKTILYVINSILKIIPKDFDYLSPEIKEKYQLPNFFDSLVNVHHPKGERDLMDNFIFRKRIALDELLANQIRLRQLRENIFEHILPKFEKRGVLLNKLNLPFELTEDQKKCIKEIEQDLCSGHAMNRLIQGDVGSGKTVVAFISMLIIIENGFQTAFLAPTEILAWQHFETIKKLSKSLNIDIDIMVSSNRKARKKQIQDLQNGITQILIGTHAILEENIEFMNLGLVVIDEQHRFGVMQRISLIKKCKYPNILAMSATPIPRTMVLGCYGDLDVSVIKNKPASRIPVETAVMNISKIDELVTRLKKMNTQIFWVCPVIEESEDLIDVNTRCDYLCKVFSEDNVKVLHGKMKAIEKDFIMHEFNHGKFKVLVCTTVIEVGVDIPNANVIVIEHAERFGLAQLHQLRGRVGRGNQKAYCILVYHNHISEIGKQRLQLMKSTNDGFILSEEDLKLRGAGDILGKEQSGFHSLRFSDFSNNYNLLTIAEEISQLIDIHSNSTKDLLNIFNRISEEYVV